MNVSHNMGEFKLIKADVNINKKNFTGYSDADYDMVNQFHKNKIFPNNFLIPTQYNF